MDVGVKIINFITRHWQRVQPKGVHTIPYNTKLSRLHGKLLFRHKTFAVAHDGPKDYARDGDY